MRITAKFNGTCAECSRRIEKGDEIEYVDRKAYHPECITIDDDSGIAEDSITLADELGFTNPKTGQFSAKTDGYMRKQ